MTAHIDHPASHISRKGAVLLALLALCVAFWIGAGWVVVASLTA